MKKVYWIIVLMFIAASSSYSQYKEGSNALLLGGSYSIFDVEYHDLTLNGYGLGGAYESNIPNTQFAVGFGVTYISATDEGDSSQVNFSALPLNLYGKYFFGSNTVRGFVSLGLGFTSSTINYTGRAVTYDNFDNGYAFNFGLGMNYYMSEKVFLNAGYNFSWWENHFINDGIGHNFILGLGFQF